MSDEDADYEQVFDDNEDEPATTSVQDAPRVSSQSGSGPDIASTELSDAEPSPHGRPRPSRPSIERSASKPIRSVLDQSPWTFTVHARRIRALRIPMAVADDAPSSARPATRTLSVVPNIRDLRLFAVVDKQPMQSHGSKWKQEPRSETPRQPLVPLRRASTSPGGSRSTASPGRRSGFLEEASWRNDDGDVQWTLTMDRFRRLKAYNPRIKLFVFGIGVNAHADSVRALSEDSPKKHHESIVSLGWFFLDLRTPDLPERWFKLQNAPFGGEIQVSTSFTPTQRAASHRDTATTNSALAGSPTNRPSTLTVTPEADHLRLGSRGGADVFLVSVFLRGAAHLTRVVPSLATRRAGYWLSYSLFDVVVQTDVFQNLERAEFPAIRDSFRIKSCVEDVREYVAQQRTLSVYLCTESHVLASAEIPIVDILTQDMVIRPACVSGEYACGNEGVVSASFSIECIEHNETKDLSNTPTPPPVIAPSVQPAHAQSRVVPHTTIVVHVQSIKLKTAALTRFAGVEPIQLELVVGAQPPLRQTVHFHAVTREYAVGECIDALVVNADDWDGSATISVSCASSFSDALVASSPEASIGHDETDRELRLPLSRDGQRIGECILTVHLGNTSSITTPTTRSLRPTDNLEANTTRMFHLSVQTKALRDFESTRPLCISFVNPFSRHGQLESPLISVVQRAEVLVPDAQWLLVVYGSADSIRSTMETPLVMDFSIVEPDGSRSVVGHAIFSLNYLFFSEETFCCAERQCGRVFKSKSLAIDHWQATHPANNSTTTTDCAHSFKTCSIYLPVMGTGSATSKRIGAVQIEAYLEDMGRMTAEQVASANAAHVPRDVSRPTQRQVVDDDSHRESPRRSTQHDAVALEEPAVSSPIYEPERVRAQRNDDVDTRDDTQLVEVQRLRAEFAEAKTAWKHEQSVVQEQWKKRFAEMEKARMDELEEEWARREEERSALVRATQSEYQQLEQKLRTTLSDVEVRERKLATAEAALEREKRLHREDSELLRRRMQSEQSHALSLAQQHVETLQKRVGELQMQLSAAEKRTLEVEADFAEYRTQQRKVPESRLREEIASLKGQLVEMEKLRLADIRAREVAEANVVKMREQLEKMAKLVQSEKKKNESRVVEELEKLRLKYIAREERYVLDGDREELRAIKKQLDDLRHLQLVGAHGAEANETSSRKKAPHGRKTATSRWHVRSSNASPTSDNGRRHSWSSSEPNSPMASTNRSAVASSGHLLDKHARLRSADISLPRSPSPRRRDENRRENAAGASDRELTRLMRERDEVLASGGYDDDHYLVRELDRRIILRQDQLQQSHH